jgi:predicted metal-dependent peptidase
VLVDTSGSVSSVALDYARGILEQVLDEVQPAGITLYFVDTDIHGIHRMERGEPLKWEPKGGGGTSFVSFFEQVERGDIQPACIIGISDLEATFGNTVPAVPVLWLTDTQDASAPFGEVVYVDR